MEIVGLMVIVLGFWVYFLSKKVSWLMEEVIRLRSGAHRSPQTTPDVQAHNNTGDAQSGANVQQSVQMMNAPLGNRIDPAQLNVSHEELTRFMPQVPGDDWSARAVEWIKKDFMVKLGAFLLLLALVWFVGFAIENGWIGPLGQIALGLIVSVAFMVLGIWRIKTYVHQGGIFTVLGSTGILVTIFAARGIYGFFDPLSALAIMFLAVVFVAFVSVRYNRNMLALAGLVLASIAPFLTVAPSPNIFDLFMYLMVVVLGTLWVVYLRGWSNLTFTALIVVFLHGIPYLSAGVESGDTDMALLFSFLFTAIFFVANILGLIANENEENRQAHIAIALGTGLYLIVWITGAAAEEWQSLLYAMWMLVFSVGSFIVYRVLESRTPFYIYGGTSVALLAAATASVLDGPVLTIAFTIEIALLVFLVAYVLRDIRTASILSLLFLGPAFGSFMSIESSMWRQGILHDDFFVLVVLGLALAFVGRYLYELSQQQADKEEMSMGSALMVAGAFYGLVLIWLILHVPVLFGYETGTMLSLVIYTLIGLALYIHGKRNEKRALTLAGGTLLGFVVARLLLIEVWQMDLGGRIVTFVVIGLLLISTAFIRRNKTTAESLPLNKNV